MAQVRSSLGPLEQVRRRHPSDLVRVVAGVGILIVASLPVRPDEIGRIETGAFDVVNGLPDSLLGLLWLPMQLGSLVAVPLVAGIALARRRWGLAVEASIAGVVAWTLAKVVKGAYGRPRPGGLLDEVAFRGGEPVGFGFVSGHTAVAFALATAVSLYVPRRWRGRVFALAAVVGLARMFVGAHLPLDVVGGAGLGWAIAAATRLALGAHTGRPTLERLRAGLDRIGLTHEDVVALPAAAGTSAVYRVEGTPHGTVFAKVLSDRPQDRDAVYRWWLRLTRQAGRDEQRFASPTLQVEFEAARTLAASAAGARVPTVHFVGRLDGDLAVLVMSWVPGRTVAEAGLSVAAAQDLDRQIALLRAASIAHGDLAPENVIVDGDRITLIDFGAATMHASPQEFAADSAAMSSIAGRQAG